MNDQTTTVSPASYLATELAEVDARLADLDAQITPLRQARAAAYQDRQAIIDLIAEQASTDAELVALSYTSEVASARISEATRALSPIIYDFTRWYPGYEDPEFTDLILAPHLYLDAPRVTTTMTANEIADLADALVEFAARFVRVVPTAEDFPDYAFPGYVFADILDRDCHETRAYGLYYQPSRAGEAILVNSRRRLPSENDIITRGTLDEVLPVAIARALEDPDR